MWFCLLVFKKTNGLCSVWYIYMARMGGSDCSAPSPPIFEIIMAQPNYANMSAAYTTLANETAHFANVGPMAGFAALNTQLAQITQRLNDLATAASVTQLADRLNNVEDGLNVRLTNVKDGLTNVKDGLNDRLTNIQQAFNEFTARQEHV